MSAACSLIEYESRPTPTCSRCCTSAAAPPGARLRALLLAARVALEDERRGHAPAPLLDQASALAAAGAAAAAARSTRCAPRSRRVQGGDGSDWSERALRERSQASATAYAIPAHFYDAALARERGDRAVLARRSRCSRICGRRRWSWPSCLLREDRCAEARVQLQAAYRGDPYDPVTVNTLRLLDSLRSSTCASTASPRASTPGIAAALILRISPRVAVLAPYARRLAEQRDRAPMRSAIASQLQRPGGDRDLSQSR